MKILKRVSIIALVYMVVVLFTYTMMWRTNSLNKLNDGENVVVLNEN